MGRVDINSLTGLSTKGLLWVIISREMVNTPGPMERSILGSERQTKWKERGSKPGKMDVSIRESS